MTYTDKIHLVSDSLEELHSYAKAVGIKRIWFDSNPKHPHYDVPKYLLNKVLETAKVVRIREILERSYHMLDKPL
jgi:FMN phosphatase YigB (HAD superfamily)